VWRLRKALDAVPTLLKQAGALELFPDTGVLRPAVEPDQVEPFQEAADEHPDLANWLSPGAVRERYPAVRPDRGALFIPRGGAVDVGAMVRALLAAAEERGATVETQAPVLYWRETPDAAVVEVDRGDGAEDLHADRVLLALGQGFPPFPELRRLGLDAVKGQTVRVHRPKDLTDALPPMSGRGYVVPDGDTLVLGSNYDNNYDDLAPDPDATQYIQEKTSNMLPGLDEAEVLHETAGARVMHSETNLPLLGPLPRRERLWTFTALGSKGLLTAPLLATELPHYLEAPHSIPDPVRIPGAEPS
jgi:glycine oxidase